MAQDKENKTPNVPPLRFPEFSGDWGKANVSELFDLYSGNTPSRNNKNNFIGDINWITSGELKTHYIGETNEKISKEAVENNNLRILPIGILIIATYGLEANGVRSTCSITQQETTISQACTAFLPKKNVSCEFLYSWYKKHGNIIGIKYAQGTKQQNLSTEIINKLIVDYPSIEEQSKLHRFITLIDQRIATQNKIIEDSEKLKSAIYDRIFSNLRQKISTLGDIVNIVKGQQINGDCLLNDGLYYVMNGGLEPSGYHNEFNTPAGTISISEGGNSCGYVQYNKVPFWSGGHCYTLKNLSDSILPLYLYHFLKWKETEIMRLRIGSGLPNIQKKDLSKVLVAVPNIVTQQSIQDCLNAIEMKIFIEQQLLISVKTLKQFLLNMLFI